MELLPFDFGNHTDKGIVRERNEDAMAYYNVHSGHLFVIADGMGGHASGEEASKLAIEFIKNYFTNTPSQENVPQLIIQAIEWANRNIYEYAMQNPSKRGMGTTVVVAYISNNIITIGHVGDSRAYRYHPETGLQALTKDHSFVQELVNQGIISEEEAHYHPRKNEITRALGINETVVPDIQQHIIKENDVFALMTDGICSLLTFEQILQILSNTTYNAQQIAENLINTANELGGYDNSTVQIISFRTTQHPHTENISLTDTHKIDHTQTTDNAQASQSLPKSATQDSGLRYYLFIGATIITIALIIYNFLLNSQIIQQNSYLSLENTPVPNQIIDSQEDSSVKKNKIPEPLFLRYRVKKGESLNTLSKYFNYPIDSIKSLNKLKKTLNKRKSGT
ncbi:MAG: hypothetical protein KatS3mg035_1586 [Bacteroidia bacterium]|nr:MAG: hypothetical protein KatS3mg035_1586 [Bacteroidia bacterium]